MQFPSLPGDFRMTFGENPHKIKNIVHGNFDGFEQLYQPILKAMPHVHVGKSVIEVWLLVVLVN
jgi:hypothetical protein